MTKPLPVRRGFSFAASGLGSAASGQSLVFLAVTLIPVL